jgi:hypothetical protein
MAVPPPLSLNVQGAEFLINVPSSNLSVSVAAAGVVPLTVAEKSLVLLAASNALTLNKY